MKIVRLTVVGNEPQAELLRALLHADGINSWYGRDLSSAVYGIAGGATEVFVQEKDFARARELMGKDAPP